jgi:hypothetical protein
MRLVCQKAFLLALVVTLACHDASGPLPIPPDFVLANINGRALPTFVSPIPEAPTILAGYVHFDASGRVALTEHQRDIAHVETIVTNTLDYRVNGDKIELGCFRPYPANIVCASGYTGTISENALSLTRTSNTPVTFNYINASAPRTVGVD